MSAARVVHITGRDTPAARLDVLSAILRSGVGGSPAAIDFRGGDALRARLPAGCCTPARVTFGTTPIELQRVINQRRPHVLHVWSPARASMALLAADQWSASSPERGGCTVVIDVDLSTPVSTLRRLHELRGATPAVVWACASRLVQRRLIEAGLPPEECLLIRGDADDAPLPRELTALLRKRLGLSEGDCGVLLLPPLTSVNPGLHAAWGTLLAGHVHPEIRLIVPHGGREVERIRYLVRSARHEHVVCFAPPLELPDLLAAANVVLFLPAGDVPVASLARAMASGKPIVASRTPAVNELLDDGRTALLCAADVPREIARCVLRLLDDPSAAQQRAEAARRAALALPGRAATVDQYGRLYALLCESPAAMGGGASEEAFV